MNDKNQNGASFVREGLFALVVSGISAAISITAIMTWLHMAESTSIVDSGGPAFAVNIGPLMNTVLGVVAGGFAFVVICGSILLSEKRFPKSFTFYHFCSLVLLIPSPFLLIRLLGK